MIVDFFVTNQRRIKGFVEAQAQVPEALAQALRQGNLGVMDYYRLNNLLADTKMREGLTAGSQEAAPKPSQPVK